MDSILQNENKCFLTGRKGALHKHHIYGGSNRRISDQNGFWVWLTPEMHNLSNEGVHFDRKKDLKLKRICQEKFEETHSREEFMALIGRNYLYEEETE